MVTDVMPLSSALLSRTSVDVLHVPFTYFPDPVGGTEIYVSGLIKALQDHDFTGAIAAPSEEDAYYAHGDVSVFRFATTRHPAFIHAYGAADETAARSFRSLIGRIRPKLVHLHAHTAAVSERLIDAAHEFGAKTLFTYHTPTVTCARGTMLRMGRAICDGKLDVRSCTACVLQGHGVPRSIGAVLAAIPESVGDALGRAKVAGGPFTALRMSALVGAGHRRFRSLMQKVDHVIAVCSWVREALLINGVPQCKLTLCRQGLVGFSWNRDLASIGRTRDSSALCLGYFGRLHPTKGVDILVEAMRRVPDLAVRLEIYGVQQRGSETYVAQLERAAAVDQRIMLRPALHAEAVIEAMSRCNLVTVPSRGLETGPLVVLEAFAAGTPVLGARLGGISELVTDNIDGVLLDADEPNVWATAIGALARDCDRIERLRAGIRAPRTMDEVAGEMASLYRSMLTRVDS
jgi:glycosyltransferase involved in cell wall biosynthesis